MSRRHRWIKGKVTGAQLCERPRFIPDIRRRKGAKAEGQRYERKIHELFDSRFGERWLQSPWFEFTAANGVEYCQADGLLWSPEDRRVCIVEIKLQHTAQAYEQLYGLYLPVVQAWLGLTWTLTLCEVVRWHRPEIRFPGPFVLSPSPDNRRTDSLSVHICNPRRESK